MNWPRSLLAVLAALGAALIAYGAVYTHGNPFASRGDPRLAFQLLPLELIVGLLVGLLVWRAFGRAIGAPRRPDAAERMVLRLAMRRGGPHPDDRPTSRPKSTAC